MGALHSKRKKKMHSLSIDYKDVMDFAANYDDPIMDIITASSVVKSSEKD